MEGKEKGRKEAVETNVVHSALFDTKNTMWFLFESCLVTPGIDPAVNNLPFFFPPFFSLVFTLPNAWITPPGLITEMPVSQISVEEVRL